METLSQATEVLNWLQGAVSGATPELLAFSYTVVGLLTLYKVLNLLVASKLKNSRIQPEVYGQVAWDFFMASLIVGLYFGYSFVFMEGMRAAGLDLAGVDSSAVSIGELARYADTVTAKVDAAVQNIYSAGFRETISHIPDIFMMRLSNLIIHIFFIILGIIGFVMMSKFFIGYLIGGTTIGGYAWQPTSGYGERSISYVLYSSLPLMALSFVQGGVMILIDGAVLADGRPASMDILTDIAVKLMMACFLVIAVPTIARELLSSMVTGHGAPDIEKLPRALANHGGAATGSVSYMSSMMKSMGGGGGGGGGSLPSPSPSSGMGGAASTAHQAPRLMDLRTKL